MIYQPVNVQPSNTTIDASVDNVFSWEFNGDTLVKYTLNMYLLNDTSVAYTTTVTPENTIYGGSTISYTIPANSITNGNEYIWKIIQYENSPSMFVVSGTVVSATSATSFVISTQMSTVQEGMSICINGEYAVISTYDESNGNITVESGLSSTPETGTIYSIYSPFSTTLNGFYIKTRKTPVVTINPLSSSVLDSNNNLIYRSATFTGSYTQEQNVSVKYHNWSLIIVSTNEIIDSTNDIYNSNLQYTFDGFVSGNEYSLSLTVVNQDNQSVTTSYNFNVLYNEPLLVETPTASWDSDNNAVKIDCRIIKVSEPDVNGTYEFTNGFLHIQSGNINYNQVSDMEINLENFTIMTEFYIDSSVAENILSLSSNTNDYVVDIQNIITGDTYNGEFYFANFNNNSGQLAPLFHNTLSCLQNTPTFDSNTNYLWMNNVNFNLDGSQYFVYNPNTINSSKLYKLLINNNQCMLQDIANNMMYTVNIDTNNTIFNSIILHSGVFYKYLMVHNITLGQEEIDNFFSSTFEPSWNLYDGIIILAPFDNSLLSSNISSLTTSNIQYIYIYRQEEGENVLHNLGQMALNQSYFEDFMVKNNTLYTWYIVPVSETEMGTSIATNSLFVHFDEWTLNPMVLDSGENGYTTPTTWKFGLNIEEQPRNQNILKTKFDGLSQYPKFTVEQRNYISGALTCYLSNVEVNPLLSTNDLEYYPDNSIYKYRSELYYEPTDMLTEWNKLVASGQEVLIRDLKGHMYRAQIDSNTATLVNYNQESPTTISFTFTETGSLDDVSVYVRGELVDGI